MEIVAKSKYLAAWAALLLATPALNVAAQSVDIVRVDVVAVGKGYRVSQLIGREVINQQDEDIGEIDDFIIGRDDVLFVILEVGGFLGIGEHRIALPATAIDMETVRGKVLIRNASRAQLQKMPEFNYGRDQGRNDGKKESNQRPR